MKRMLIKETALYNDFSLLNSPVREIRGGEIVELGNVIKESGNEWIEVLLNNTVTGYIKGDTPLLDLEKYCYIDQEFVDVHEAPDINSRIIRKYTKNEEIYLVDRVTDLVTNWYKIFDINGNSGYIEAGSNIKSTDVYGKTMILNEDNVNIYNSPDINSGVLSTRLSGVEFTLLKLEKDSRGNRWFFINMPEGNGYIPGNTSMISSQEYKEWKSELERDRQERIDLDTTGYFRLEKWFFKKGTVGGAILFGVGLIWLLVGYYLANRIYLYTFVLIGIGFIAIIRDLIISKKDINFCIKLASLVLIIVITYLLIS